MKKPLYIILMISICIAGALLNYLINLLAFYYFEIPLYLDTILTIAITFFAGLWWGCLTGALTNIIGTILLAPVWGWEGTLFALCNIATAVIVWWFIRLFPKEISLGNGGLKTGQKYSADIFIKSSRINRMMNSIIVLTLLASALCLGMSILGGTIATIINIVKQTADINMGLLHTELAHINLFSQNMPLIAGQILSRIPVNIVDRLISVFAGYGIAMLIKKINLTTKHTKYTKERKDIEL